MKRTDSPGGGPFISFRVSSGLGAFLAIVRMEEGMTQSDARKDAMGMAQSALMGFVQLAMEGQTLTALPDDAWSEDCAKGWGWMAKHGR